MKVKITPEMRISLMHAECIDLTDIVGPMTAERDELAMKLDKSREQHAATLDRLYEIFNIDEKDGEVVAKLALLKAQEVADRVNTLDKALTGRMLRTGEIEELLLKMANGKLALPNQQDCRVLALRLGTPKKSWSDIVKNHQFKKPDGGAA